MIKRMIEDVQPPDDNELDCESDECERAGLDVLRYDARGPHQPVHHTNRDLVPTAKANKDLLRRPVLPHTERVFDMLRLAGCVKLTDLLPPAGCPLGQALAILHEDPSPFVISKPESTFAPTSVEHRKFASELIGSQLARVRRRKDRELGYAKFFTVVKKVRLDGVPILRTILDCKAASTAFCDPLPVNLAPLPDILDAFRNVEAMRALDLRHWYHQIPVSQHLSSWFNVAFGALRVQWSVLPMGWKWACFVAQAISTYLVAGDRAFSWNEIPRIITLGRVKVVVVYDNIVAGGPRDELDVVWAALHERITAIGAIVKEDFVTVNPGDSISALGIEWCPSPAGLRWRLLDKFVRKAVDIASSLTGIVSLKTVASAIGVIAWSRYACRSALFDLQPAYRLLSAIVAERGWRSSTHADQFNVLRPLLADIPFLGWQSHAVIRQELLVFTDAHVSGYGVIGGDPLRAVSGAWSRRHESADMFYLESLAVKIGINLLAPCHTRVFLAVDNKALMFAIQKRSTACPRTSRVLAQLFELLAVRASTVSVGWIPTADNPADELSRSLPCNLEKLARASLKVSWTSPPAPVWGSCLGRVVG
eukprot:PhM_4_TR16079/c8_g2_i1/m.94305